LLLLLSASCIRASSKLAIFSDASWHTQQQQQQQQHRQRQWL
jgi:hypothetical protein